MHHAVRREDRKEFFEVRRSSKKFSARVFRSGSFFFNQKFVFSVAAVRFAPIELLYLLTRGCIVLSALRSHSFELGKEN